jgi:hypothetical protein
MANLPKKFRKSPEANINFDYTDIIEGVGYKLYYGAQGASGAYLVTSNPFYAERIHTSSGAIISKNTFDKHFDYDFDLKFNNPVNLVGDVFMNVPFGLNNQSGENNAFLMQLAGLVYHYDGSTETLLASGASIVFYTDALASDGVEYGDMALIKANIPTAQHFNTGEILRFTLQGYYKTTSGDATEAAYVGIAHDPQNRNDVDIKTSQTATQYQVIDGTKPTKMEFHVPFQVDV